MAAKIFLNNLTIPSPCDADWNSMKGNDQIRFCEHCNLDVHNLSQMTHSQARRLVNQSQGRLCVRYYRDPNGGPRTLPLTHKITRLGRRASRIAAGAFTATLSVTSAVAQNVASAQSPGLNAPNATQPNARWTAVGSIAGTVTDQNGAAIAGATISISNSDSQLSLYTSTGDDGQFRIENLPEGTYNVRIEAPGFAAAQTSLYLRASYDARVDETLHIASLEETVEVDSGETVSLGGVVSMVLPENPFIRAAQQDDLEVLTSLLAGMDVNLRDPASGTTALEHAVGNANREMVQLLLAAGARVNNRNATGRTVLMMLDHDATSDLIWDLINAGAKVDLKDANGTTALMQVASGGNVEAIRTLLDAGAEIDTRNEDGQTALMMAAAEGEVNIVRTLVLAGADINARDEDEKTALSLALENNHPAVVRFLKAQGAVEMFAEKTKVQ